jgi:CRP-like cAMP-binding protein
MAKPLDNDRNLDDVTTFVVSGQAGDFVFREGDSGTDLYIIQEGQIEIERQYAGVTRQLAVLEAGDFLGEMSLFEELPREASARALTDYRLLRIDASTFAQIVQEDPEIAVRMLRKLSRRLRERQDADARAAEIAQGPLRAAMKSLETPNQDARRADAPATPESAAPAPRRLVLVETASGTEFILSDRAEATVGRIDRATGFTPDFDLSPFDTQRTLSRRHAKIVSRDGEFYVREEVGTRNGTFVNGERVTTGVEVRLGDGAQVRFGQVETVFHDR